MMMIMMDNDDDYDNVDDDDDDDDDHDHGHDDNGEILKIKCFIVVMITGNRDRLPEDEMIRSIYIGKVEYITELLHWRS